MSVATSAHGVSSHASLRDGVPECLKQAEIINTLIWKYGTPKNPGKSFYLIDSSWFLEWKSFSEGNFAAHPGPIDNSPLLDDTELKEHLVHGFDYHVIPREAWVLLKQWYGGGPEIIRKSVSASSGTIDVEVYPYKVYISVASFLYGQWDYSLERELRLSCKTTLQELWEQLLQKLCPLYFEKIEGFYEQSPQLKKLMGNKAGRNRKMKLHLAKYGDNFTNISLNSKMHLTLEQLGLNQNKAQKSRFLLEVERANRTWPTKKQLSIQGEAQETVQDSNFFFDPQFQDQAQPTGSKEAFLKALGPYTRPSKKNILNIGVKRKRHEAIAVSEESEDIVAFSAGNVGLANLGNTCYMNSVLQALAHSRTFVEYFLLNNFEKENEESEIDTSLQLKEVFQLMHSARYSSIYLNKFRLFVGTKNRMFRGYRQHDAEEFLTFLLDRVEIETSSKSTTNFVQDIIGFKTLSKVCCTECNHESISREDSLMLRLPLNEENSTIQSLIEDYLKEEQLLASELWYCSSCEELRAATKKLSFDTETLPEILVVQLKRFTATGTKLLDNVTFPLEQNLNLTPYVGNETKYRLFSVVNHFGVCGGGHYTNYARCEDGVWRSFNDDYVKTLEEVPSTLGSSAYLLFFERV